MTEHQIFDNFLDDALFEQLRDQICGGGFSWYKGDLEFDNSPRYCFQFIFQGEYNRSIN